MNWLPQIKIGSTDVIVDDCICEIRVLEIFWFGRMIELSMLRHLQEDERSARMPKAEVLEIWRSIEILTADECSSVQLLCANPDFNGLPNHAIACFGEWTDFEWRRFAAERQVDCFRGAVAAYSDWASR